MDLSSFQSYLTRVGIFNPGGSKRCDVDVSACVDASDAKDGKDVCEVGWWRGSESEIFADDGSDVVTDSTIRKISTWTPRNTQQLSPSRISKFSKSLMEKLPEGVLLEFTGEQIKALQVEFFTPDQLNRMGWERLGLLSRAQWEKVPATTLVQLSWENLQQVDCHVMVKYPSSCAQAQMCSQRCLNSDEIAVALFLPVMSF